MNEQNSTTFTLYMVDPVMYMQYLHTDDMMLTDNILLMTKWLIDYVKFQMKFNEKVSKFLRFSWKFIYFIYKFIYFIYKFIYFIYKFFYFIYKFFYFIYKFNFNPNLVDLKNGKKFFFHFNLAWTLWIWFECGNLFIIKLFDLYLWFYLIFL